MKRLSFLACVAVLLMAPIVNAGTPATDQFLVSVGRGPGAFDSLWLTSISIFNVTDNENEVHVQFLKRNQTNPNPLDVPYLLGPQEQVVIDDVMLEKFGIEKGFGAIRILSQYEVIAASRTFNANTTTADGEVGTAGVWINGVSRETSRFHTTDLIGLQENEDFRTNVAFVEVEGKLLLVNMCLYDDQNNELGCRELTLEPYEAFQRNILDFFPNAPSDRALRVRIEAPLFGGPLEDPDRYGGRLLALGTVVDTVTNDGSAVEMSFDSWRPLEGVYQLQIVEQPGNRRVGIITFELRKNPHPGEPPFPSTEYYLWAWYYLYPLKCGEYETVHMSTYPNGTQFHVGIEPAGGVLHAGDYLHQGGPFGRNQLPNGDFIEYYTDSQFWISANGLVRGWFKYGIRAGTTGVWAECIGQALDYEVYGGWVASLDELGNPNPFEK